MNRISAQVKERRDLAFRALSWITCAFVPLKASQLIYALAIEPSDRELDNDNFVDEDTLISACFGLITIEEETNVIRLVHYTTQEFFERTKDRLFPDAHTKIADELLTFLLFKLTESEHNRFKAVFPARAAICEERLREFLPSARLDMYKYAFQYWPIHVRYSCITQIEGKVIALFVRPINVWLALNGYTSLDVRYEESWRRARLRPLLLGRFLLGRFLLKYYDAITLCYSFRAHWNIEEMVG